MVYKFYNPCAVESCSEISRKIAYDKDGLSFRLQILNFFSALDLSLFDRYTYS